MRRRSGGWGRRRGVGLVMVGVVVVGFVGGGGRFGREFGGGAGRGMVGGAGRW